MKKIFFAAIPTGVAMTYIIAQLTMAYVFLKGAFFSPSFIPELILCGIFGILYVIAGYRTGKIPYVIVAIPSFIVGALVFVIFGGGIFLLSNLSI